MSPCNLSKLLKPFTPKICSTVAVALAAAATSLLAANGTWTNAPVDNTWTNIYNWVGQVPPGQVNNTVNNGIDNSVATFNSPIYSGLGGAANPIRIDDATVLNGKGRMLGSIIFDSVNCGAYSFYSPSPAVLESASNPETGVLNLCHNGSVTMNASVTNSQTFLLPVEIRLPSSTWGVYNFINNSTNLAAILYFNSVSNHSATSRSTTYYLGGSNAGTNTIASLSKGTTTSSTAVEGIVKQGTGTWVLTGPSDFSGSGASININGGLLIVKDPNAFGTVATASVNTNGTLQIDGVTLSQTLKLNQSGAVRMNGSATINGVAIGTLNGTTPTVATTSGSDVLALGNADNMVTGGAADSVLHVAGPGTVQLGYTNNYVGSWSVDAGTLQISGAAGALGSGANLHLAPGATLDVTPATGSGASYNPAIAGISAAGTGTAVGSTAATIKADATGTIDLATGSKSVALSYAPTAFAGDSLHPALYVSQGTLSLGGNTFTVDNVSGTPLGTGTYTLILQAGGSIASSGGLVLANVTGSGLAAGTVGSIVANGSEVDLVVANYTPKNLVWQGGNPNNNWDVNATLNFLNGGLASVFNNSDFVTFDSTGVANPNVNVAATLAPGSVTVDTSAGNYTFSGSGQIAGPTGLTKTGSGTLQLATVNTYGGNTVISNGVIQLGVSEAIPSPATAGGDVEVKGAGMLDLNGFTNTINALLGSGTVDTVSGGTPVLTVGNNNDDGAFSGAIQNTSGSLSLVKVGTGKQVLSGINTYSGSTTLSAGTLGIASSQSLPTGNAVVVNGGTLDLGGDITVGSLTGTIPGTIANNSTSTTNVLTINNTAGTSMTYNGHIDDNTGTGGALALKVLDAGSGQVITIGAPVGSPSLNNYSGGTLISNAFVSVGDDYSAGANSLGIGPITLAGTNYTVLAMPRAVLGSSAGTDPIAQPIILAPNTEAQFVAGGRPYGTTSGGVSGPASSELIWNNHYVRSDVDGSWTNFYGKIEAGSFNYGLTAGDFRLHGGQNGFNGFPNARVQLMAAGALMGDYTVYTNAVSAYMYSAVAGQTYYFGELSAQDGTTIDLGTSTIIVGSLGTDSAINGSFVSGSLVKDGTGTLTLVGGAVTNVTTPDGFTFYTNVFYTNLLTYTGSTTISNGVLKVALPDTLTNGPTTITLAAPTAVLDASDMGYISNYSDATVTNQYLIKNGIFEVVSGQTLGGLGTIRASKVLLDNGATLNVGLPTGVLTATNNVELAGAVRLNLARANTPNSGELAAQSFTIDSTATLVVTNVGSDLVNGDKFTLFNHAVDTNLFASVTLPPTDSTGTNTYVWQNDLSVDGTITLVSGGASPINTNPPPIISSFDVGTHTLSLSWPTNSGWILQMQTNNLSAGLGTNWVDVSGSATMTSTNITVDATAPTVFYRLRLP